MKDIFADWRDEREEESRQDPEVVSITVLLRARDGTERTVEIDPSESDALFWTVGAFDRLLMPFYCARRGFEFASAVRRQFVDDKTGLIVIPILHKKLCKLPFFRVDLGDPAPFRMK